jgi:hypothetical protein
MIPEAVFLESVNFFAKWETIRALIKGLLAIGRLLLGGI